MKFKSPPSSGSWHLNPKCHGRVKCMDNFLPVVWPCKRVVGRNVSRKALEINFKGMGPV
jgi:hypothetical protein